MKDSGAYYPNKRSRTLKGAGMGLIHVYYGQGVGKTTRAVGLAVRAAGGGLKVVYVQFLKSGTSSEVQAFSKIGHIDFRCPGEHPFILSSGPQSIHFDHANKALAYALETVEAKPTPDLLICDEILDTIFFGLLKKEQLLELANKCKGKIELVMTGREAPKEIMTLADYATEFVNIKHPYDSGGLARKGIEY
jgi:cob(I)alamin adenosyltransferase